MQLLANLGMPDHTYETNFSKYFPLLLSVLIIIYYLFILYFTSVKITIKKPQLKLGLLIPNKLNIKIYTNNTKI